MEISRILSHVQEFLVIDNNNDNINKNWGSLEKPLRSPTSPTSETVVLSELREPVTGRPSLPRPP